MIHLRVQDQWGLTFSEKHHLDNHVDRIHINPLPPAVSRGEQIVRCTLTDHNVRFKVEKKFRDLRGSGHGYLRYDYATPGRDGRYLLIEFQGQQHYRPIRFSSDQTDIKLLEKLRVTKLHDNLKVRYAQEHGLPLLTTRYDEVGGIDELVSDFLAEHQDML